MEKKAVIRWSALLTLAAVGGAFDLMLGWVLIDAAAQSGGDPAGTLEMIAKVAAGGDAVVIRVAFLLTLGAGIGWTMYQNNRDQKLLRADLALLRKASVTGSQVQLLVLEHLRREAPAGSAHLGRIEELEAKLLGIDPDTDEK